jgi:hypothetical protein
MLLKIFLTVLFLMNLFEERNPTNKYPPITNANTKMHGELDRKLKSLLKSE